MRGVRGMECRVASSKRLRRAEMRVFSTPFCGRDGESLSIRARGGRHGSAASVMHPVEPGFYVGAWVCRLHISTARLLILHLACLPCVFFGIDPLHVAVSCRAGAHPIVAGLQIACRSDCDGTAGLPGIRLPGPARRAAHGELPDGIAPAGARSGH